MKSRLHASIRGRVHGVFFRANAVREAAKLGLMGWVRNLNDGSVEVLAEGEKSGLEKFLEWLHSGPPAAKVDSVE